MPITPSSVPTSQSRHSFSWFLLIIANVLWAASYVAAKLALRDFSVTLMLALRMGLSALVLLPWLIAKRRELKLTRRDIPHSDFSKCLLDLKTLIEHI